MLDFGLPELFLIIAVTVLVIGPDQVPGLMYKFGKFLNRMRGLRFALSKQFDDFMDEVELREDNKKSSTPPREADEAAYDEAAHDEDEAYITPKPDILDKDPGDRSEQTASLFEQSESELDQTKEEPEDKSEDKGTSS